MGRIAQVLTKSLLFPSFSTFWPQDWNASMGAAVAGRQISVTPDSAMGVMAYYAGVRVLAESLASLPLLIYRRLEPAGKDRATDHPMYRILHDQANPEMTSFTWRETSMGHLVGWGNCFSERQLDGRDRTIALWPLRPDRMTVRREPRRADGTPGPLVYQYRTPDSTGGQVVELPANRVLHIRGLGYDGLIGYSPIEIMRRAIALSLSAQEYGERTFENDARPGVVYSHPKTLSTKARENLESSIARNHEGLSNAQRFAVLEEGIEVTAIGFPPEQAQFLETRKFQTREIARALRLPPHMIGDLDQATFSNIEQQAIDFVTHSLRPWLVRWEAQLWSDLIADPEYSVEFLVDGLLRGDGLSRAQKLWIEYQGGALSPDEWRGIENRNPLPDGTGAIYLRPANLTPLEDGALPKPPAPVPDTTVIPDTIPLKPDVPSQNGRTGVPA